MLELLAKVIPLDVALLFASPMFLALAIFYLSSQLRPKARTLAFVFGMLVLGIPVAIAGFFVGQATVPDSGPTAASAIIDLALGVLFAFLAIKALRSKGAGARGDQSKTYHIVWRSLMLGFVLNILNIDALFLIFAGAKEISAANLSGGFNILLITFSLICFTAPVTLPLLLTLIFPHAAALVLGKVNRFMVKYSKYIVFVIFIGFAALLIYRGVQFFF